VTTSFNLTASLAQDQQAEESAKVDKRIAGRAKPVLGVRKYLPDGMLASARLLGSVAVEKKQD